MKGQSIIKIITNLTATVNLLSSQGGISISGNRAFFATIFDLKFNVNLNKP